MTAVFLGAGSGMAFAGTAGSAGNTTNNPAGGAVESAENAVDGVGEGLPDVTGILTDTDVTNIVNGVVKGLSNQKDHDRHGPHCGCHPQKSDAEKKKEEEARNHPCPPEQKKDEGTKPESTPSSTGSADTKSEESSPKVQSIADVSDSSVDSASTSPSSDDSSQVDSASTDDTTPVGAADTGDGSSSPGFTPTFTPAASSSPLDNPYALGGGAAAAALLGAYGVSVARRRTGAHRG